MKVRSLFASLVLGILAVCLAQARANAQAFQGQFTLQEEARWGVGTLPAGNYTFTIGSLQPGGIVAIRGEGKAIMAVAGSRNDDVSSDPSSLLLVRRAGAFTVRSLHLAEVGVDLYYPAGKAPMQIQADNRQDVVRVPVIATGK